MATLFSAMHEAGHAFYELGSNPAYERTPLAGGTSLAVHESQSRLWENLVGRSLPFWEHFYPDLKKAFPSQLDGVSLKAFYKGINKVESSFIRVNADEATYNLHVMLRLELEVGMVDGSFAVKDLPEIWNTKMQEYLGIVPPNNALGVLQDVHWSNGLMGYFSTYALGNLVSAQLWEKINKTSKTSTIRSARANSTPCSTGCKKRFTPSATNTTRRISFKRSLAPGSIQPPTYAT